MGASSSKVARKAAGEAGRRQYPSTSSIRNTTPNTPSVTSQPPPARPIGPAQVHPDPSGASPSDTKSEHVDLDGRDPQFGSALRRVGSVRRVSEPRPHEDTFPASGQPPISQHTQNIFPSSSASMNPAVALVQARNRIAKRWEQETENLGRGSFGGRTLISATDIKEALRLRDEAGKSAEEVEKQMRLRPGLLAALAAKGLVANA